MKEELTKWFPADVSPVYPGVYEISCDASLGRGYRLWDGAHWHAAAVECFDDPGEDTRQRAAAKDELVKPMRNSWRGLAEPYEGWKP